MDAPEDGSDPGSRSLAAGQEAGGARVAPRHQVLGMAEVVAPDAARIDRREHDELDSGRRGVRLGQKAVISGDGERGQQHVDRALGQLPGTFEIAHVEHVHPSRTEGDRT